MPIDMFGSQTARYAMLKFSSHSRIGAMRIGLPLKSRLKQIRIIFVGTSIVQIGFPDCSCQSTYTIVAEFASKNWAEF